MRRFVRGLALTTALLAACSPRFDWREVRSADGGFAVLLPDRPQTVARDIDFAGGRIPMTMTSTGVGPTMFAVGVARLPAQSIADPAAVERAVAYFREALLRNIGGHVTAARPVPLAAAGGRSLRAAESVVARGQIGADGRAAQLAARFYVADDRFYQVVALGAEGELSDDVLETFFSSFRLLPN
ncbi:MAG: hypothetical protein OHK0044_26620 [Burkholderiaceae bacterium]